MGTLLCGPTIGVYAYVQCSQIILYDGNTMHKIHINSWSVCNNEECV